MGRTTCEDDNILGISLNCNNIHYLLRVIDGSHFSTFSHVLYANTKYFNKSAT
jgi:hypothetical protein